MQDAPPAFAPARRTRFIRLMASLSTPTLRPAFEIVANVDPFLRVAEDLSEHLDFIPITSGTVRGDVVGELVPGGGDWCRTRIADDSYRLEARYLFRASSGAVVDVVNTGILRHLPRGTGGPSEMGYFITAPVFRTADPDLAWLTRSVFVGRAVSAAASTTISVFEVVV